LRELLEQLKKLRKEIGAQMMAEMKIKEELMTPSIDMNEHRQLYEPMQVDPSHRLKSPMKVFNNGEKDSGKEDTLDGLLEYLEINSEQTSTPVLPPFPKDTTSPIN
jgi:hypothetical protein